jgi:glycosyl hydrolase family 31/uncharacterized protein DUF5110
MLNQMTNRYDRRDILKGAGAVCATGFLWPASRETSQQNLQIAGRAVEVQILPVSRHTCRLSVLPIESGQPQSVKGNGSLVQASWGPRGDEYLWGRDVLVAPVVEKDAPFRRVYLPRGHWYDFWTNERFHGGREIERAVDLETLPLFIREGAILPFGPVKQYVNEKVDGPLLITVYPGADGEFHYYEDDGVSFRYGKGDWMGLQLKWNDAQLTLTIHPAAGSRLRPPMPRSIEVKLGNSSKHAEFNGRPLQVRFA